MNAGFDEGLGPQQWFQSLPIVTQVWFGASVVVTVSGNLGFIDLTQFLFDTKLVFRHMELWRLVTCFCYVGPFEFSSLLLCYVLVTTSLNYEKMGPYNTGAGGGTADYVTALMFAMVCIFVVQIWIYPLVPLFTINLVDFVMYIWSRRHPHMNVNMWGVPMKAVYLPFAYLALNAAMGNNVRPMIEGMVIGHIYYFLVDVAPSLHGIRVLQTPQILIDIIGMGEYRT